MIIFNNSFEPFAYDYCLQHFRFSLFLLLLLPFLWLPFHDMFLLNWYYCTHVNNLLNLFNISQMCMCLELPLRFILEENNVFLSQKQLIVCISSSKDETLEISLYVLTCPLLWPLCRSCLHNYWIICLILRSGIQTYTVSITAFKNSVIFIFNRTGLAYKHSYNPQSEGLEENLL